MNIFGIVFLMLLCALIYFGARFEYRRKSPVLTFYVALIFLFVWPTANALVLGEGRFPDWVYAYASAFATSYVLCFSLVRALLGRSPGAHRVWRRLFFRLPDLGPKEPVWAIFFVLVLGFGCFLVGLKITGFARAMSLNWWDVVQSGSAVVLLGTYMTYSSASLLILAHQSRHNHAGRSIAFFLLTLFFLVFAIFVLKTRSYVLIFLVPYFMYVLYSDEKKRVLPILGYGCAIVFLFVLTRAVRHADDLDQFFDLGVLHFLGGAASGAETDFVDAFFYFIYNGNAFAGFGDNITLQRVLLFWVPSFGDWSKPTDFSYFMHAAYYGSSPSEGLSMHPTVFGDAYGNSGFFGSILYSVLLAAFFSFIEFVARASRSLLVSIALFSLLIVNSLTFARGAVYNGFMFTIIPAIALLLFLRCTYILKNLRWSLR